MASELPAKAKLSLIWMARLVAGGVFIYAAVPKIIDPATFAETIRNYRAFPVGSEHLLATLTPAVELVAGVSVITGFKRRAGAWVLSGLTVSFLLLIASVIWRGIDTECGCFGEAQQASTVGWPLFFRDVGLLAATLAATVNMPGTPKPRPPSD